MNSERCTLAAVASSDCQYIYAVGGFNGKPSNIAERYSILTNTWEYVTPLKRPRFMHAICYLTFKKTQPHLDINSTNNLNSLNMLGSPTSNSSN
jgi:Kelch motif